MTLTRNQTIIALLLAALFFGFTLLQASWLADTPVGRPRLVADHGVDPVRDTSGCIATANSGYGAVASSPHVGALQGAAGAGADAVRITTQGNNEGLVIGPQFTSDCPADKAFVLPTIAETANAMTRPELFWQIEGAAEAAMLLARLPADARKRSVIIGDEAAVGAIRQARPETRAFSVRQARTCATEYRLTGLWGDVPASCRNATMLLTLGDLGYTLWGWPDRFLARMSAANVQVIIARRIEDEAIKGLTEVDQYGDIARSFNGYIWVENIEELGPALRR